MKKLFTTMLMLTVALAGWSQLTVTDWDAENGILELNYAGGGLPDKPHEIKAILGEGQDGATHKVTKLVLTGVISNSEISSEEFSKLLNECIPEKENPEAPDKTIELDLTGCTNLYSIYESVTDYYPGGEGNASATFTYQPSNGNPATSTQEYPVSSSIVNKGEVTVYGNNFTFTLPSPLNESDKYFVTAENPYNTQENCEVRFQNGTWEIQIWGSFHSFEPNTVTAYSYVKNNQTIYVSEEDPGLNADKTIYTETITVATEAMSFAKFKNKINSIIFPNSPNFTFIPNELLMEAKNLTNATIPENVVAIGNSAFQKAQNLKTVSFPSNLEEIGTTAFEKTALESVNLYNTKVKRIRAVTFEDCYSLTEFTGPKNLERIDVKAFMESGLQTVTLSSCKIIEFGAFNNAASLATVSFPTNLETIAQRAFYKTAIVDVDLSMCHALTLIDLYSFNEISALTTVKVCSHPKVIKGGQGSGAFYNSKNIRRVEVTACDDITDITQCKCECGAFDQDITFCGTNADFDQVEANAAILVFPSTAPVVKPADADKYYTSPFDFFVGDYKAGSLIVQEGLEGYHKDVPNSGYGTYKYKDENGQDVWTSVSCDYQINDGWHEFIKTEFGQIIEPEPTGEFLRTYSRSIGSGPCLLPKEITAYRAVDYKTSDRAYIKDKNGDYYCQDESVAEENRVYIKITSETPETEYAGKNRYSYLMVGGQVYLRRLVASLATLKDTQGNPILYDTKEHKQFYDNLIFNKNNPDYANETQPDAVPGGISYVPENTGVVLYSYGLNEEYLLVLGGTFSSDYVLPEYKHSEKRYEEDRENTEPDNINMLQGTFDVKTLVSPVFPWFGQDPETGKGGSYNDKKGKRAYRNFVFNKPTRMWLRVKPGIAKDNFAFASIPVDRFDNFNEGMNDPNFDILDLGENNSDANTMLISIFEDGSESVVDGIKTVNTISNNSENNAWYTIQGVRVAQPTKGVYIHNGKKVVIK